MGQTTQILCARCRIPLEGPAEPNPDDRVACPTCGEGDGFDAVMNEVCEYIQEMAAQKLSDMVAGIGGRSDAISVQSNHRRSGRVWRFIADVEL